MTAIGQRKGKNVVGTYRARAHDHLLRVRRDENDPQKQIHCEIGARSRGGCEPSPVRS